MKRYTRHIHLQKTNRGDNTTAAYGEPNQSTKSIKEVILSPMYTLTQSQNRYKKELLKDWSKHSLSSKALLFHSLQMDPKNAKRSNFFPFLVNRDTIPT